MFLKTHCEKEKYKEKKNNKLNHKFTTILARKLEFSRSGLIKITVPFI